MSRFGGARVIALSLSYVFDWVIVIAVWVAAGVVGRLAPNKRPFSTSDLDINFPSSEDTISNGLLIVCSLAIPALLIFLVTIFLIPGSTVPRSVPKSLIWKRKLWEWHAGWLGLAASLAVATMITSGLKNLAGVPRPDLLARCQPDLNNVAKYIVGAYQNADQDDQLVSASICQNTDTSSVENGFRSFPSGHSSYAAAGLVYLSLFLAAKFIAAFPYLAHQNNDNADSHLTAFPSWNQKSPSARNQGSSGFEVPITTPKDDPNAHDIHADNAEAMIGARNEGAAPPLYLLLIAAVPTFVAMFIAATRYSDFKHHGFDILFGFFIGLVTAVFSFRFYHLPIGRGGGWCWGPRSAEKSFWAGVGSDTFGGQAEYHQVQLDMEMGTIGDNDTPPSLS